VAATTTWRDVPVLESILRLNRRGQLATPSHIADEAVLHLGDVYDSIATLVNAGVIEIADAPTHFADNAIVVTLTAPLEAIRRFGIMGGTNQRPRNELVAVTPERDDAHYETTHHRAPRSVP
jgi:hypothetical protein